jgi:hypothetical protein
LVAVPFQVIVAVADSSNLLREVGLVEEALTRFGPSTEDEPMTPDAQVVQLDPNVTDPAEIGDILDLLPTLQAVGRSVDLNYLAPVLPNNVFRPYDDPHGATAQQVAAFVEPGFSDEQHSTASGTTVAVIDSTDDQRVYDVDGNGYIDEDHDHGAFVRSIIERTGATVKLYPVVPNTTNTTTTNTNTTTTTPNPSVLASGRWAPMMMEDADIIKALESVTNDLTSGEVKTSVVNMSLGGVGCLPGPTGYDYGIGERLPLARKMDNLRIAGTQAEVPIQVTFVAAAGNNGADVLHFPAAWRNDDVTTAYVNHVTSEVWADIDAMHTNLKPVIHAVGSVEREPEDTPRTDAPSIFTNCGAWVDAAAYGSLQVGVYPASAPGQFVTPTIPSPSLDPQLDYAVWSGTSFATANFTAALVTGLVDPDPKNFDATAFDPITGARMTDPANGLPCPP